MWLLIPTLSILARGAIGLETDAITLAGDYFSYKNIKHVCFLSCEPRKENIKLVKHLMGRDVRVSVRTGENTDNLEKLLTQWDIAVGVLLDASCPHLEDILETCSRLTLFDDVHVWLVLNTRNYDNDTEIYENNTEITDSMTNYLEEKFGNLNLSVNADIAVAFSRGDRYQLVDVFNFGKIQGNHLEQTCLGSWKPNNGLNVSLEGFKYYNRWDFHNLTLRGASVIVNAPKVFSPSMLEDVSFTPGVTAMTKIAAQLLDIVKEEHNFRFNYTIVGRWVGTPPDRNSSPGVASLLFWGEQDISVTCFRIFPSWLDWIEPFLPATTHLQTKVYYLIPDKGVGDYENRFLTPLSGGVWLCAGAVALLCAMVLAFGAAVERHPEPTVYAVWSVVATICQQDYEDGIPLLKMFSSQSRRLTLLVIGLTSMLLFNYYTSSVVSWLMNAPPPTIDSIDGLIRSSLELIFADIGYNRQWLDSPLSFYYNSYYDPKEDELREAKVTRAKRTAALFQSVEDGVELIRTGSYAYHCEPYTVSQVIARRFTDTELCELGSLQMMQPAYVYIVGQKRSPYKQFFTWSLMRLLEGGLIQASQARVGGSIPPCSGQIPRALALGQAAPAFALLVETYCLAALILLFEVLWYRAQKRRVDQKSVHAKNQRERAIITHITHWEEGNTLQDIKKQ